MKHVKGEKWGGHDVFQNNYNELVNNSTDFCWTYYIPFKTKSFYGIIGWFEEKIYGFQGKLWGGKRNYKQEFDFIVEVVKWGGAAEESDVGSIFRGDGCLIKITDSLLINFLIAENGKGMED